MSRLAFSLQFPKKRIYPICFATFLMYLAWHPIGDFIESLIIGWSIVPRELFSRKFYVWWVPFAQNFTHSYTFAFLGFFIILTILFYFWYLLDKKLKINKYIVAIILVVVVFFVFVPNFIPSKSVAYQNDISGFKAHNMQPLKLWMYFHMIWWFIWMIFPHLLGLFTKERTMLKISAVVWGVFLVIWLSSLALGKFIYVPII